MPGFQRKVGIWSDEQQSRLIESMLIKIPLPSFYVDATNDDNWLIVDGLQRLTTIKRFVIDGELKLSGLEYLKKLEDKTFNELSRNFQRRIEETQVTVFSIEKNSPPEVKFNIFKRINTGGMPLSPQEIRHALNQGKATKLLRRLVQKRVFREAIDYGIHDKRMAAQECILRFMAFTIYSYEKYKTNDLDSFLNKTMININKMEDREIHSLEDQFIRAMVMSRKIFGKYAFRKLYEEDRWRYPINKALFEAWSVNFNRLTDKQFTILEKRKKILIEKFITLMHNSKFESAISQGTSNVLRVHLRFSKIEEIIQETLS
jgi:uncharacterized protein with ParB-like and HNH nuclease domain